MKTWRQLFTRRSLIFASLLFIFTNSLLNAATITQVRNFESGNLGGLKCSGNCPTVTTNPVAGGKYAGNFTLTQQMKNDFRTEVVMGSDGLFDFGKEYWLGMDYRYEDWKKDSNAEMAPFQIHTRPSDYTPSCSLGSAVGSAPFFMISQDDKVRFVTYKNKTLWTGDVEKKEWLHITVHFRISYGSDGFIEAWKDGVRLGRVNGPNTPKIDGCGKLMKRPYFKMGVYKWDWKRKNTDSSRRQIFIDNLKIAVGSNGSSLVGSDPITSIAEEPVVPISIVSTPEPSPEAINTEEDSLIAHWSMENGTNTSIPDISGNEHTGTLVNGAKLITGEGVKFDGVNDYLNVGNLDVAGDEISLSAWFMADDLDNCKARDCRIISKSTGSGEQDHYFMVSTIQVGSDTRLRFRLKTNGVTSTLIADSGIIYENEWTHVTAVYDGALMILYKDGVEVGNRTKQGNITVNSGVSTWIGANPRNAESRPWKGHIDDVRIYNFPLSDDEIDLLTRTTTSSTEEPVVPDTEEPVVPDTEEPVVSSTENPSESVVGTIEEDLVAYWSMETDEGTLRNGAKLIPGEGVKLDGVNDYLNVGNLDIAGDAITLSAWFVTDDLDNCKARDCRIISKATGSGEQDHYFMVSTIQVGSGSDTRLRFRLKTNGVTSTLIADSGNIYENEWTHVTAVYDGEMMILYKDGVEVGNRSKQGNITVNSGVPVWIGDNPLNSGARPWEGNIDDVRIYDFPLTDDEISLLAHTTTLSTDEPSEPPVASNTEEDSVAYWSMETEGGTLRNGAKSITGEGVKFDGVNDRMDLGVIDVPGAKMSISFWFKADDFDVGDARFISKATGTSSNSHYWMVSTSKKTKLRFRLKTNGSTTTLISPIGTISAGQWHHVTVTYDGHKMKIYRDGELVASTAKTGQIDTNSNVPVAIGNQPANAGSRAFDGLIDDVRIYDFSLTNNEIGVLAQ